MTAEEFRLFCASAGLCHGREGMATRFPAFRQLMQRSGCYLPSMTAEELHLCTSAGLQNGGTGGSVRGEWQMNCGSCAPAGHGGEPTLGARLPVFAAVGPSCWLCVPVEPPPASVRSPSSPYLPSALATLGVSCADSLARRHLCMAIAGTESKCRLQLFSNVQK